MAVRQVNQWKAFPGRNAETVAAFKESKIIHERLGFRVRAFQTIASGATTGVFSYVLESDSLVEHLERLTAVQKDKDFIALILRVLETNNPVAQSMFAGISTEIQGLEAGPLDAPSGSLAAWVLEWHIKPGRIGDAVRFAREGTANQRALGATTYCSMNNFAGEDVRQITSVVIARGLTGVGEFMAQQALDPASVAFSKQLNAEDCPVTLTRSSLLREIPI